MSQRTIIGIDPGLHGAVAVLHPDGRAAVHDIPTVVIKGTRMDYLPSSFRDLLEDCLPARGQAHVVIEKPPSNARASSMTMLQQGRGVGLAEGIVVGLSHAGVSYELVEAAAWTGGMKVQGRDKGAHVVAAQKLFPDLELRTPRGRLLDGRADAVLIAAWYERAEGIRAKKVAKVTR